MADTPDTTVPDLKVRAQEPKVLENPEPREPQATVVNEEVPAQVTQPREPEVDTVQVHETSVTLDTVITDTSDPNAVIVPPEGRGDASLPIHAAVGKTVEQVFAESASEESSPSDDDRAEAAASGTTVDSARGSSDE